jgi:hypothetical protein
MNITSNIMLNDSDIIKLEKGPVAWANARVGSRRDVDQFTKDLAEQINKCGFTCEVKVFDTNQEETYGFEIEINGRTAGSVFDPDKQVHEVTHNLLELPGEQEGFVKSKEWLDRIANREMKRKGSQGGRYHKGC